MGFSHSACDQRRAVASGAVPHDQRRECGRRHADRALHQVCASDVQELDRWARENVDGRSRAAEFAGHPPVAASHPKDRKPEAADDRAQHQFAVERHGVSFVSPKPRLRPGVEATSRSSGSQRPSSSCETGGCARTSARWRPAQARCFMRPSMGESRPERTSRISCSTSHRAHWQSSVPKLVVSCSHRLQSFAAHDVSRGMIYRRSRAPPPVPDGRAVAPPAPDASCWAKASVSSDAICGSDLVGGLTAAGGLRRWELQPAGLLRRHADLDLHAA